MSWLCRATDHGKRVCRSPFMSKLASSGKFGICDDEDLEVSYMATSICALFATVAWRSGTSCTAFYQTSDDSQSDISRRDLQYPPSPLQSVGFSKPKTRKPPRVCCACDLSVSDEASLTRSLPHHSKLFCHCFGSSYCTCQRFVAGRRWSPPITTSVNCAEAIPPTSGFPMCFVAGGRSNICSSRLLV